MGPDLSYYHRLSYPALCSTFSSLLLFTPKSNANDVVIVATCVGFLSLALYKVTLSRVN
jgi:hypothetical protein